MHGETLKLKSKCLLAVSLSFFTLMTRKMWSLLGFILQIFQPRSGSYNTHRSLWLSYNSVGIILCLEAASHVLETW